MITGQQLCDMFNKKIVDKWLVKKLVMPIGKIALLFFNVWDIDFIQVSFINFFQKVVDVNVL